MTCTCAGHDDCSILINFGTMRPFTLILFLTITIFGAFRNGIQAQPLTYHETLITKGLKTNSIPLVFSILQNENKIVYKERQTVMTDSSGGYHVNIGTGQSHIGQINDIIWSDGNYKLLIKPDSVLSGIELYSKEIPIRKETDLKRPHQEGIVLEKDAQGGRFSIPNPYGKKPAKITLDLSTSYVNVDYPAGDYPVYRHFEWFDEDGDGKGNALNLTYSEKTTHAVFLATKKIGEVKLFTKPFQEFVVASLMPIIEVEISKPERITYYNETYAIKGPWKIIYYVEWEN